MTQVVRADAETALTLGIASRCMSCRQGLDPFCFRRNVKESQTGRLAVAKELDQRPRLLYVAAGLGTLAGAVVWGLGWLVLRGQGVSTHYWDAVWALAAVSFLNSLVVPIPGITATLLLALSRFPLIGVVGCLGAAFGSTTGASILLGLGHTGREHLHRRATHSHWARRTLEWSKRLAKRWTYVGVTILLVPQFIPKLVTLYAAVLVKLKAVPFLAAVYVGVFLRNLLVLGTFALLPDWLWPWS